MRSRCAACCLALLTRRTFALFAHLLLLLLVERGVSGLDLAALRVGPLVLLLRSLAGRDTCLDGL